MQEVKVRRFSKSSFGDMLVVLLTNRGLAVGLVIMITVQCAVTVIGIPGYRCPFRATLSLPCPGCGLTRGVIALLRGDFAAMWHYHPFTPYVVAMGTLLAISTLLRPPSRQKLATVLSGIETRTHLHATILMSMLIFGLARLVICWSGAGH